jgi:pimeloyl-ACP methyl ester carboxylesterase
MGFIRIIASRQEDSALVTTAWEFVARNWALASILLTVVILVVAPWLILRKYVRIMFNILRDTPPPLSMGPRDFLRIQGEPVTFRAFDGLSLRGMFLFGDHKGQPKGLIIFAHEFASDMYSCARYCRPLLAAGYDIFTFDFRGHGESSNLENYQVRQWVTNHELSDMMGALAYVEDWLEAQGRPKEVGLYGISRGGGAAILSAAHNPCVRAIVADSAFSNDTTLEHLMKRWAYIFAKVRFVYENHPPQFWRFLRWLLFRECRRKLRCELPSVRKALARMKPRPILFIHGDKDSYIPFEQALMLYELAARPKHLWIVQGAKHNQSVITQPQRYADRTVAFFHRYLAGISAAAEARWLDEPANIIAVNRASLAARRRRRTG